MPEKAMELTRPPVQYDLGKKRPQPLELRWDHSLAVQGLGTIRRQ